MENVFNKLRGGYYTPIDVTEFISKWAIRSNTDMVLEPSCGDGHFLEAAKERFLALDAGDELIKDNILGIELYETEVQKAKKYGTSVVCGDFFKYYKENIKDHRKFQAVVGNPPFIRYQSFDEKYRKCAFELVSEVGINLTRLSNIWLPFLILSCECLEPEQGRLGMVIPAELLQVDYAKEARSYLSKKFDHLLIITFKKLLFEDAQQEVVLLLGECKSKRKGIEVVELENASSLKNFIVDNECSEVKTLDHSVEKWTKYFLTNKELDVLRKLETRKELVSTEKLFEVNVGIVSGQNKFFIIDKENVEKRNLQNSVRPIIGRAEQLKGVSLTDSDFGDLVEQNKKVFLFMPSKEKLSFEEEKYIHFGEEKNYHSGYKCRIRKSWYVVPQSWKPEAFMLRQINKYPKMIINETEATNTDTLHKIRFLEGIDGKSVVAAFLNSFTLAQSEITGRSYGGGVMTFEPGEVRKLRVPMCGADRLDLRYIDALMRKKDIYKVLEYTDKILLIDGMGLTVEEVEVLREIWNKLSDRRLYRKIDRKRR